MPIAHVNGIDLYHEETGQGIPLVWSHEFGGDYRIPHAGLVTFPACGHTLNIEEPGLFNLHVGEFLAAVDCGRWAGWVR